MARHSREYAITPEDRVSEIRRRFGADLEDEVHESLSAVADPSDRVLGAIVFLARDGHLEDVRLGVELANTDPERLLNAATVKAERR